MSRFRDIQSPSPQGNTVYVKYLRVAIAILHHTLNLTLTVLIQGSALPPSAFSGLGWNYSWLMHIFIFSIPICNISRLQPQACGGLNYGETKLGFQCKEISLLFLLAKTINSTVALMLKGVIYCKS